MASIMEGLVNSLDTEKFIDAVKNHPAIWDSSHEDHSDRGAKKLAWDAVISTFVADYEDKSTLEKKNLGNAFSRKWKSLRDCYSRELSKKRKELQSGSAVTFRKEYIYYEQLKFLGTVKNNNANEEDGECSKDNDSDPNDPDYPEEPLPKRARRCKEPKNYNEQKGPKQKVVDPDRLFMLSLVPEMKKIPDHMKLEMKSRLLSVFTGALSRNTPRTKNPTSSVHSHVNQHHVNVPTVHVTVPISINYDSNPIQPEIMTNLHEDIKSEHLSNGSDHDLDESDY